jgi:hypothetical protein
VKHTEIVVSFSKPLFRRPDKPEAGFVVVLRDTKAACVAISEVKLGAGVSLFRRHAKPPDGFGIILPCALAFRVTPAKMKLRLGVALLRSFAITLKSFRPFNLPQHAVKITGLIG